MNAFFYDQFVFLSRARLGKGQTLWAGIVVSSLRRQFQMYYYYHFICFEFVSTSEARHKKGGKSICGYWVVMIKEGHVHKLGSFKVIWVFFLEFVFGSEGGRLRETRGLGCEGLMDLFFSLSLLRLLLFVASLSRDDSREDGNIIISSSHSKRFVVHR